MTLLCLSLLPTFANCASEPRENPPKESPPDMEFSLEALPEPPRWDIRDISFNGSITHIACARATSVSVERPLGSRDAVLCVRRGSSTRVFLHTGFGSLNCSEDCTIIVSFDGEESQVFQGPTEVSGMVYIEPEERFIRRLLSANSLEIRVDLLYHSGTEFVFSDIGGLTWEFVEEPPARRRRRR